MSKELPKRPERDPDEQSRIVKPTDRVKSAGDKPDPRFEAARLKAEREERLRATRRPRGGEAEGAETAHADETGIEDPSDPEETDKESDGALGDRRGFSFNRTARDAEEDE
jgi:hypothetical protein